MTTSRGYAATAEPAPTASPAHAPAAGASPTAGDLIAATTRLLRRHPAPLLVPFVLLGVARAVLADGALAAGLRAAWSPLWAPLRAGLSMLLALSAVALAFAAAYVALATARAAFMPYLGEGAPRFGVAASAVRPVLAHGLVALVLATALVAVGFLLLVVPGLVVLGGFIAVPAVVVAEGLSGPDALRRSWALTAAARWDTALVALAAVAAAVIATVAFARIPHAGPFLIGASQGALLAFLAVASTVHYAARHGMVAPQTTVGATGPL